MQNTLFSLWLVARRQSRKNHQSAIFFWSDCSAACSMRPESDWRHREELEFWAGKDKNRNDFWSGCSHPSLLPFHLLELDANMWEAIRWYTATVLASWILLALLLDYDEPVRDLIKSFVMQMERMYALCLLIWMYWDAAMYWAMCLLSAWKDLTFYSSSIALL